MSSNYYDWEKTLSYDADVTMVIGARGIGKTFGLRKQCIRDFIKNGYRFCEIVRYKNELTTVSDGYFNRLAKQKEFKDYMFKTDSRHMYIAERKYEDSKNKHWQLLGYFIALSEEQKSKKLTYDNVKRLIFDEALINRRTDKFHHYLTNEFYIIAGIVDTVSRERADTDGVKPRLYLLGNACDIANPYFAAYNVESDLTYGYHWYSNKTFLLHYVQSSNYSNKKATDTVAGRMIANSEAGKVSIDNEFVVKKSGFVKKKTKNAKFSFGIKLNGKIFGIWVDLHDGYYYVTSKVPKNTTKPIYYLTRDDASINYLAANRVSELMRYVSEMYSYNLIRYDNEIIEYEFGNVLKLFGVR